MTDWYHLIRPGKIFRSGDLVTTVGSIWKIIGGIQYTYDTFDGKIENVYKVKRIEIIENNPYCSRPSNIGDIALFSSWGLNKKDAI